MQDKRIVTHAVLRWARLKAMAAKQHHHNCVESCITVLHFLPCEVNGETMTKTFDIINNPTNKKKKNGSRKKNDRKAPARVNMA